MKAKAKTELDQIEQNPAETIRLRNCFVNSNFYIQIRKKLETF